LIYFTEILHQEWRKPNDARIGRPTRIWANRLEESYYGIPASHITIGTMQNCFYEEKALAVAAYIPDRTEFEPAFFDDDD
jgi:hypothetical protein